VYLLEWISTRIFSSVSVKFTQISTPRRSAIVPTIPRETVKVSAPHAASSSFAARAEDIGHPDTKGQQHNHHQNNKNNEKIEQIQAPRFTSPLRITLNTGARGLVLAD
jgi:hypothetical protein